MLNEVLRLMRIFHDLTQKDLAEKLGMSKSHLSEIESGKKTPTLALLESYSQVFKIPVWVILFFSEENKDVDTEKLRGLIASNTLSLMKLIAERSGRNNAEQSLEEISH